MPNSLMLPVDLPIGITIPDDATEAEVLRLGQQIAGMDHLNPWWRGDYLNQVDLKHGSIYEQAESLFRRDPNRLAKNKWTAKTFPIAQRLQYPSLDYSHFEEVASLPANVAKRLLNLAVEHKWSSAKDLRRARKLAQRLLKLSSKTLAERRETEPDTLFDVKIKQKSLSGPAHVLREKTLGELIDRLIEEEKIRPDDILEINIEAYFLEVGKHEK